MRYAETGFDLEIDLSRGSIEKVATEPRDTELYLGGQGSPPRSCLKGFRLTRILFLRTIY